MNQTTPLGPVGAALPRACKRRTLPGVLCLLTLFVPVAVGTKSWAQPDMDFRGAQFFRQQLKYPTNSPAELLDPTNATVFTNARAELVEQQAQQRFCVGEKLNAKEKEVSENLKAYVRKQFERHRTQTTFEPARPFHQVKGSISTSELFQLLRQMPKGGLLHTHLSAAGRMDWIISNALTLSNCYVSWKSDTDPGRGGLSFCSPPHRGIPDGFKPVGELVAKFHYATGGFGAELRRLLTIGPEDDGPKRTWDEFGTLFGKLNGFIRYRPVFTNYLFDAFETLWNDGVYYVELRDSAASLYSLDGRPDLKDEDVIREIIKVRNMMTNAHPNFDCRLILADVRAENAAKAMTNLARAFRLRQAFTNFVIGYDLVGEEDRNIGDTNAQKVAALLPALQAVQREHGARKGTLDLPYYLHDGESAWADNDNVLDALLLKAPRIGHGFNLFRYPTLYPLLIATNNYWLSPSNAALEVCPVSNQMLGLIQDLRLHPAHGYLNAGIQCVLASDDPAFFGNDGLSYDFWEAIMAWNLDLAAIKKLARNSIAYSGLLIDERKRLALFWEGEWDRFIERERVINRVTSKQP